MLPHEGHIPTLPGQTNTGERYISIAYTHGRGREPYYKVFSAPGRNGSRAPGHQRYFPPTPEGFAAAIEYRDAVLAGQATVTVLARPSTFLSRALRLRGDRFDPGARAHPVRASVTRGLHRETRPDLPFEFEWKPTYSDADVSDHVGRMLRIKDAGGETMPLIAPSVPADAIEWAAKYEVVVIDAAELPQVAVSA